MSTEETIAQQVVDLVNSNSEEIVEAVTETVKETVAEVIKETSTASTVSDIALNKYAELLVSIDPYFKKVSDTLNTIPYFKQVSDTLNSMPGKYLYAIDKLKLTPAYKWLFTKIPFPNFTVPEWLTLHAVIVILLTLLLGVIVHVSSSKQSSKKSVQSNEPTLVDLTSEKTLRGIEEEAKREAIREKEREKARAKRESSTEHEIIMSPQGKTVRIKKEWMDPVTPGMRKSSRLLGFGTVATPDGRRSSRLQTKRK